MFGVINQFSRSRLSWFLLFLSTIIFEGTALFFQHGLGLAPCSLCIYQRVVLFGIMLASLIGFFAPKKLIFRLLGIAIWLFSAYRGFEYATLQARLQFQPRLTDTCSLFPEFPSWLPLREWFPHIFESSGFCADKVWSFLTIEMSQWMIIIFACYFIVGLVILFSQCFRPKRSSIWQSKQ